MTARRDKGPSGCSPRQRFLPVAYEERGVGIFNIWGARSMCFVPLVGRDSVSGSR
jgi:hypothetical protein